MCTQAGVQVQGNGFAAREGQRGVEAGEHGVEEATQESGGRKGREGYEAEER